ncbi:hypothetical protein DRF60_06115 [Chryseobacterium elymi]|uniref:Uncharacterized protein n=1 Tax=Chryseobacterium elymi TaxID=395936 RepID=A0A3D9DN06_9FLAO|nr:hypothetical protein DRF60_06115 [Chryseobacterium elymi]
MAFMRLNRSLYSLFFLYVNRQQLISVHSFRCGYSEKDIKSLFPGYKNSKIPPPGLYFIVILMLNDHFRIKNEYHFKQTVNEINIFVQ